MEVGPRAEALLYAIETGLQTTLSKVKFSRMAVSFPQLYNDENVGWLQKAHTKAVRLIREKTQAELDRLITSGKFS